ncbi:MAG TPA: FHA domain-containing protein [Bryobacteraceae bacterium]|nr:FHA domain-containing protein [Bryobacteraceae bacterium]
MKISELIERLGRTVFEGPFGATAQLVGESPEVAEIRIAVLDEVRRKIQRAGGEALFPYNLVRIHIRASGDEAAVFQHDFFRRYFDDELRKCLAKEACRFPEDLRVRVATATDGKPLRVEMLAEEMQPPPEELPRAKRIAKLVVSAGTANKSEIPLQKARTNIGRLGDVYKAEGVSRRNDLAFADDNAINRTVSREHAHIVRDDKTGEYRLFNDRWYQRGEKAANSGLWIVRDGLGREVHRDTRGTRLEPGDEIHFGKAVVKFQLK